MKKLITVCLVAMFVCVSSTKADTWTNLDYPGAWETLPTGSNGNNIVGYYANSGAYYNQGFVYIIKKSPRIGIEHLVDSVTLYWTSPANGFVVQTTERLIPTSWETITNVPLWNNNRWNVTLTITNQQMFYRLYKP